MTVPELSSSELRDLFPAGTVMHNPVTGEYARVVEHNPELAVGELLAVPGGAVAGPHLHPTQEERFEVIDGVMGYRLGDHRGELRAEARGCRAACGDVRERDRLRAPATRSSARAGGHERADRPPAWPVGDGRGHARGGRPGRAVAGTLLKGCGGRF
jgi:hypothetical protein